MPEQENKGRVPSPVLLHPRRERGKGGVVFGWYGGAAAVKTYWKKERM